MGLLYSVSKDVVTKKLFSLLCLLPFEIKCLREYMMKLDTRVNTGHSTSLDVGSTGKEWKKM